MLAGQAPDLREALERASDEGLPHVILDGTIIPTDRCGADPQRQRRGHRPVVLRQGPPPRRQHPGGLGPRRVPAVGLRRRARLGARHHRRPRPRPARALRRSGAGLPTLADPGYDGAGIGIHIPSNSPPTAGPRHRHPHPQRLQRSLRCLANAGSPCSPAAGAPSSTSPPAPARSATSPAPRSSSPISSTATYMKFAEITSLLGATATHVF